MQWGFISSPRQLPEAAGQQTTKVKPATLTSMHAGWVRRVKGETRAGSRQEISTVVVGGGGEALSSEAGTGAGKEA